MTVVESNENDIFKNTNKKVLLYSGGLDSTCTAWIINPDILLFNDTDSNYGKYEKDRAIDIYKKYFNLEQLVVEDVFKQYVHDYERKDFIVPNRNALFVLGASLFGETIYLAATVGDRSFDKDYVFTERMSALLNHMWYKQHWTEERVFSVVLPFKHMTKYQLLRYAVQKNMPIECALDTFSCYNPSLNETYDTYKGQECGSCKACVRNWAALYLLINMKENEELIDSQQLSITELNERLSSKYIYESVESLLEPKLFEKILQEKWRGREDIDLLKAILLYKENNGDLL